MSDFFQNGLISTLHDFAEVPCEILEKKILKFVSTKPLGLILPVTGQDMNATAFARIVENLKEVKYLERIVIVLGKTTDTNDYKKAVEMAKSIGPHVKVLWVDGQRVQKLYKLLEDNDIKIGSSGKGQAVWTAFGYLLAEKNLHAYILHDCDIVNYDKRILARLCLPMVWPGFDYEYCKAYYARFSDKMYGRASRLFVTPLIRALKLIVGEHQFLNYLDSFRYPLSGEFGITVGLARASRIPSDWGLEIGMLAEIYRNTAMKRICQIDICKQYEHKHQSLSEQNEQEGLNKMSTDIALTLFRALASFGVPITQQIMTALEIAYLRLAQDTIARYSHDAVMNDIKFERHMEELAIETFARALCRAGDQFFSSHRESNTIPNWSRVLSIEPNFPNYLQEASEEDLKEFGT